MVSSADVHFICQTSDEQSTMGDEQMGDGLLSAEALLAATNVQASQEIQQQLTGCGQEQFRMASTCVQENKDSGPERGDPPQEAASQFDMLQFQNSFYECIEELKIRRVIDAENEEKMNQLVSIQHDCQRAIKEEISKHSSLSEEYSQELCELKRQHEEKIHQLQAEKSKLALAADSWGKEMKEIKDDIRTLQLTKYSLEKTIKDQDQRLQMQGSARSSHLSKMNELEALGKEVGKQCSAVAEQLKKLEANVKESQKLNSRLSFINQHQTCTSDSLRTDLKKKINEIVCLRAQLDEKPSQDEGETKAERSRQKQIEKQLKQTENTCRQLSKQLDAARAANQCSLDSLARSQQLAERHLASSNQNAERASILAKDIENLESELRQVREDLCTKEEAWRAEKQRNQEIAAQSQLQEESLRSKLRAQQDENTSLMDARDSLEELNSNWSKKNNEMLNLIRELQEKVAESENREEGKANKETKSTNTEVELWRHTVDPTVGPSRENSISRKAEPSHVTTKTQKVDDDKTDENLLEKADTNTSMTFHDTSSDQINMQMESSATEQVPASAQCEQLKLPVAVSVKDGTAGLSQAEDNQSNITVEVGVMYHRQGDDVMEDAKVCQAQRVEPSNANGSTDSSSVLSFIAERGISRGMHIEADNAKQEPGNGKEMLMQEPGHPCGIKQEFQPSDNNATQTTTKCKTITAFECQENNRIPSCRSTYEPMQGVNKVDPSKHPREQLSSAEPSTSFHILSFKGMQLIKHHKPINHLGQDGTSPDPVLHAQPTEMDVIQQDFNQKNDTRSVDCTNFQGTADKYPSQLMQSKDLEKLKNVPEETHRASVPGPGSVSLTDSLSSKFLLNSQGQKLKLPSSSSASTVCGTRPSYILPGFSLIAAQPRHGVTPRANPSHIVPPTSHPCAGDSVNEVPSLGKLKDHKKSPDKCSSLKEKEDSQEWPNFAEEFESGTSSAPLPIDCSTSLRTKSTTDRAEVSPCIGSKRPSRDDEPLLFSDDEDDEADIKSDVANQINRIQSFLRSDRLKRPKRSSTTAKGPVV